MGQNPPPLMWGNSVPAYGMDGNQTAAGAMYQAGQLTNNMMGFASLPFRIAWNPFTGIPDAISMFNGARNLGAAMTGQGGGCLAAGNAVFGQAPGNGLPWSWYGALGGSLMGGAAGGGIGWARGRRIGGGRGGRVGGIWGGVFGFAGGFVGGGFTGGDGANWRQIQNGATTGGWIGIALGWLGGGRAKPPPFGHPLDW
jgi:hypothetical protein